MKTYGTEEMKLLLLYFKRRFDRVVSFMLHTVYLPEIPSLG
jgi:hypothetical protein